MAESPLTTRLVEEEQRQQAAAAERFTGIVQRLADGEEPDPAEVLEIVKAAGRTASELNAEVQRQKRIAQLEKEITEAEAELQRCREESRIANAELEAGREEFRKAEEKWAAIAHKAQGTVNNSRDVGQRLGSLREELRVLTYVPPPSPPRPPQNLPSLAYSFTPAPQLPNIQGPVGMTQERPFHSEFTPGNVR